MADMGPGTECGGRVEAIGRGGGAWGWVPIHKTEIEVGTIDGDGNSTLDSETGCTDTGTGTQRIDSIHRSLCFLYLSFRV